MPASTATAAAWLPPAGDAALQAAVRSADTSTVAPRSLRRGDASHFVAGPVPALADAAPAAAAEWLPPVATPGAAAPSPTAASAPSALPQAPVDTSAPRWHEAFAGRVQWLVDQRVGEARIKLNPPELGAVDVKISLVEDKTYVQLTAATAAARDELAQSLPRLRELFTASGLELGGASVHGGGRGGHAGAGGGGGGYDPAPRYGADLPALELPVPPERGRPGLRAAGAIDVFA
jgi:flagellar hook-length control protein FliK